MKQTSLIVLTISVLTLAGCGKLTEANYAKLKSGMSYQEVTGVLGSADHCDETIGVKQCIWGDEERNIKAKFVADKALLFSSKNIR